ncbi:MAG TPA: hypothetical protein VF857_07970, partial [Spirochaetota bacterium]
RRAADTRLSNTPYIAYVRDGEAVSLHEINCGIGRLTKMILSRDEAFSVLAHNLSMIEFYGSVTALDEAVHSPARDAFSQNGFRQLFFSHKQVFFDEKSRSTVHPLLDTGAHLRRVTAAAAKLASLEWLLVGNDKMALSDNCGT